MSRFLAPIAALVGIYAFLGYAPDMMGPDGRPLGAAFRIFYMHVPAAWIAFLAFFVSFVASAGYLITRKNRCDTLAVSSAEVGWVFSTIVITTGPIWAKAAWGTYWTWEPRLTSFLVLWLMYLGYLVLRGSMDPGDRRARYCAMLGILAFLDIPIVFLSIKLWGAIGHPPSGGGFFRDPGIRNAVIANTVAFVIIAWHLIRRREEVERHVA